MERLVNSNMTPGQDRDGYFMKKTLARFRGHQNGRAHIIRTQNQGFTRPRVNRRLRGHKAHDVSHHDPTFGKSKGKIPGRTVAMTAGTSIFHNCGRQEDYVRSCYQDKADITNRGTWTPVHPVRPSGLFLWFRSVGQTRGWSLCSRPASLKHPGGVITKMTHLT